MTYQIAVDNVLIFSGNAVTVAAASGIAIVIFVLVLLYVIKKIRASQVIKYEFITIIAHKFRTPLTQIKWLLETLVPEEPDPLRRKNLQDMQKANEKLIVLTSTLIELTNSTRKKAGLAYSIDRTCMYDLVKEVADSLKGLFEEKNISFSVQATDPTLAAHINVPGIRFVLQSLMENSCAYSPVGRRVDIVIFERRGKVHTAITDNGIGIRPQDLSKIFSKFYRASNARKMDTEGFGISLSLSSSIVRRNNGVLKVFSPGLNQGSTFTIILPKAKDEIQFHEYTT